MSETKECPVCLGSGVIRITTVDGTTVIEKQCHYCNGIGRVRK